MKVLQIGITVVMLLSLSGCSSLQSDKLIDYRAKAKQQPTLEVPPDLTTPETDDRYKVPLTDSAKSGVATYSDYSKNSISQDGGVSSVLPEVPGVRIEREGARRWLVVNKNPENVWLVVKSFWQDIGLVIVSEDQAAGVMETDWAENRAKIPQSALRNMLGKLLDSAYSSGELDQYLTRLERNADGKSTEVYITHRGREKVFSKDKTLSKWQTRANDPELEAVLLQRLMVRFGVSKTQAENAMADNGVMSANTSKDSALIVAGTSSLRQLPDGATVIVVNDAFDRSWRRAGLAIESASLVLEDKDREQGIYFLRPIKLQNSWFEWLKFWKWGDQADQQYLVKVKDGGVLCEVSVTDQDGVSNKVTNKLLEEIYKYINQ